MQTDIGLTHWIHSALSRLGPQDWEAGFTHCSSGLQPWEGDWTGLKEASQREDQTWRAELKGRDFNH